MMLDEEPFEYRVWFNKNGKEICLRVKSETNKYFDVSVQIDLACKELQKKYGEFTHIMNVVYKDDEGRWWEANALDPYKQRAIDKIRTWEEEHEMNPFDKGNIIVFTI